MHVRAFDDLDVNLGTGGGEAVAEFWSLLTAVGVELEQKRIEAEQRAHQQHTAVAILHVGGMHDGPHRQALCVNQDVPLLTFDLLAGVVAWRIDRAPPFFGALDGLAVNDRRCGTGLPARCLTTRNIERVMDALQRPVPVPSPEVIVDRAPRRQINRFFSCLPGT